MRHVHFVAICGTGMGSLAGLLKARGLEVTGSDDAFYPPMSEALERWQIPLVEGFSAANVLERRPDLVVVGNAVRPDNPEARAAMDAGIPFRSFPDALRELAMPDRHAVVVTGTHGKTTTTSMLATLLHETGRDPSFLVAGLPANFSGSFREGGGPHFVVEGDEYDTAFFDKTPKFLHYGARTAILTSVEFDHADIYRDLEDVKASFRELVRSLPRDGTLVAALDQAEVRSVAAGTPCPVVGYGVGDRSEAEWRARILEVTPEATEFEVSRGAGSAARARLAMHGVHNVANALAALVSCEVLGVPLGEACAALEAYRGVRRRQEIRGEAAGVVVVDDFAHHPTAVAGTIQALRARFPERRLVAAFEPRSNTSRRALFQREYVRALAGADRILISRVPDAPIYSAFGEAKDRLDADVLAAELGERGRDALALDGPEPIVAELVSGSRPGDVVLVMSNGSFGNLPGRLLEALRSR